MKITRFEDLEVWKLSREFIVSIYKCSTNTKFKNDFELISQLRRASTKIINYES